MRRILFLLGLIVLLLAVVIEQRHDKRVTMPSATIETTNTAESGVVLKAGFEHMEKEPSDAKPPDEKSADLVLARLTEWDNDDNPALRQERLQELGRLLSGSNALEIVQALPANLMGYVLGVPSFRQKLLENPQTALDWMACHPNVQSQLLTLLQDWAGKNADEMQKCLSGMPDGAWKETVLSAAANEALSQDPAQAIATALQMESGPQQTQWLRQATTEWARQNPNAAGEWAIQIAPGDLRNQLLASVAVGAAESNPDQSLDFLEQFQLPDTDFNQSVADMAWLWALKDPNATATWVAQLSEAPARQMALENVMAVWGNHQADAATSWVEELPDGSFQLQAAKVLYSALSDAGEPSPHGAQ